jgi:hypothetical protein
MVRIGLLSIVLLPLAACGSDSDRPNEPDVQATNATVEEVAEQVREAGAGDQFIRPGKWVSELRFEEMAVPGMPAGTTDRLNDMIAGGQSFESCLTEEQARRPSEQFFAGRNNNCRYENFTMDGGRIDATMRCTQDGAQQVMQMEGDYSPDSYNLRMTSRVRGNDGDMRVRMRIDAKRVGDCDPAAE